MSFGEDADTENKQQLSNFDEGIQAQGTLHKTVPSGIPGFDEALGEGLVEGNIYLIVSDSGEHSKQISHQILFNRIISKSRVTYYTFEDSSADIIEEMAHYNIHIHLTAPTVTADALYLVLALAEGVTISSAEHPVGPVVEFPLQINDCCP